ncbi:TetR/AcrR family transcriptional regulator [Streptomyces durmitorensis]|uniref:TetR family transcriptional regulator C-terminal domain-containing protein n=1 Tax=Streptomyces durmitorensis TaxID=319947 RepID=A0ABY4Q7C0_9ACTN|nr:TetR family transcriptional regulator C-terminal domain-containing protein [Streptomyces durmitorensis]UQT61047.1 TetR family transcriptional regulator C-terminal domain-containing protein [Streptomyces durmitorensis]
MPKVVDPQLRRRELAEAVWRVVRRDGLDHASVRNVAREAGLSMGSLRHYFVSQSELMAFALRMVIDRIEQRIAALPPDDDPLRHAARTLAELLPLDDQRRAENEVWLAFTARAMTDPELRTLRDEGYEALRAGCRGLVAGLVSPGRDPEQETARLHALVDGLAVHAAMRPDVETPESMYAVVVDHLAELRTPRAARPPAEP